MTFYNRYGILYARINGKRVSTKLKDTPKNRKLFESYAENDEFFKKFNVGKEIPTVIELCEEVLKEKEYTLKPTSYRAYLSLFNNRIVPYFDKKLITEFKPKHIDIWYKTFSDKQSIITCEAILKPAFEKAILREYISSSPFIIKKPSLKSNYQINPFSIKEINRILNFAPIRLKNIIAITFYSGMRIGEVLGLKWNDIDFTNATINVKRTRTNGYEDSPKTDTSFRTIDIINQCEEYLKKQQKITGLCEYVFLNTKHEPYSSSASFNYMWNKTLKDSEIEKRSIYQLRHSFASNMLSNGEDLLWVSSMMGHSNPHITLSKYSKFIRSKRERKTTFLDTKNTKSTQVS